MHTAAWLRSDSRCGSFEWIGGRSKRQDSACAVLRVGRGIDDATTSGVQSQKGSRSSVLSAALRVVAVTRLSNLGMDCGGGRSATVLRADADADGEEGDSPGRRACSKLASTKPCSDSHMSECASHVAKIRPPVNATRGRLALCYIRVRGQRAPPTAARADELRATAADSHARPPDKPFLVQGPSPTNCT
jgi:hypothetical protein